MIYKNKGLFFSSVDEDASLRITAKVYKKTNEFI